jgi:hypothetical protein
MTTISQPQTDVKENTHLMIVKHSSDKIEPPVYFSSLKEATDEGESIIRSNPDAECNVYQMRVILKGKIVVDSTHFNVGKIDK